MTFSPLPPHRTPGDFKILREYLGLPARWLANSLGVLDRQIRRWEQGAAEIPLTAWEVLNEVLNQSRAAESDVIKQIKSSPGGLIYAPRNDSELWRDFPQLKQASLPASYYRAVLARVAVQEGVSLYYNPEPLTQSAALALSPDEQYLDKYYPATMDGGPFNDRELAIEYEPPHPRYPFSKLPFLSDAVGDPTFHYELVPDSVMLSERGFGVIECRYTFVGYDPQPSQVPRALSVETAS